MMKNYTLFKILSFLCFLLVASSCEKDEFKHSASSSKNFEVRRISFNEVPQKKEVAWILEKIESKNAMLQGKGIYDSINKFTVHTDEVVLITSEDTHWLNFYISREPTGEDLENLVLLWDPIYKGYVPFLAQYNLTKEDSINIKNCTYIENLPTKTDVDLLGGKVAQCWDMFFIGYYVDEQCDIILIWEWRQVPCNPEEGGPGSSGGSEENDNSNTGYPGENGGFYPGGVQEVIL